MQPVATQESVNTTPDGLSGESGRENAGIDACVRRKRRVATATVDCRWMFNQAQASRGLILVDTRPREQYEQDSIPSAVNIPPPENGDTQEYSLEQAEASMLPEQRFLFTSKKRHLREIVLFGDLVRRSGTAPFDQGDKQPTVDISPQSRIQQALSNAHQDRLRQLLIEEGSVMSVKTLSDGFLAFKYRYPFFTTASRLEQFASATAGITRTHSGTHNVNYPNEILEGFLFLGNMWHAQSEEVRKHLGITHVVNASLDTDNAFEGKGVKYCEVKIKDHPDADISAYFNQVFTFIESAKRTQHGRVLIHCTQGISRSGTLVIMYLMRAHRWSLVTAVNYALSSRGVVYPNTGFLRALQMEELRLYKGSSLAEEEFDLLLQQQLPDRPVPIQQKNARRTDRCAHCRKLFGILEWKHRCKYCTKSYCAKCTSTRLAAPERAMDTPDTAGENQGRRVCDICVGRLWQINLPRPRRSAPTQLRTATASTNSVHTSYSNGLYGMEPAHARLKSLKVNGLSTFGKPVTISFFEGTELETLLNVIRTRFQVKDREIIDLSTDHGEPVSDVTDLPDDASVTVSVGKDGYIQEGIPKPIMEPDGFRYALLKNGSAATERTIRHRHSITEVELPEVGSNGKEKLLETEAAREKANKKFGELWRLSFPNLCAVEREELLKLEDPKLLMDVMLGMSSMSYGTLKLKSFHRRLGELGYSDTDKEHILSLLDKARRK